MTAWPHIDAMGIGDVECGVTDLIAGLGEVLDNSQVSGIIVSNLFGYWPDWNCLSNYLANHQAWFGRGFGRDKIIICGTMRDKGRR